MEWTDRAACFAEALECPRCEGAGVEPDGDPDEKCELCIGNGTVHPHVLFFPADEDSNNDARPAKRICLSCPVNVECLDYATRTGITHGIWGGHGKSLLAWVRSQYVEAVKTGNMSVYRAALVRAFAELRVQLRVPGAERAWQPERTCSRCGSVIRAGRHPIDRNGPETNCSNVSAYNKGSRCLPSRAAKSKAERRRYSDRS